MKEKFKDRYEKLGLMISVYRRKKRLTQESLGEILDIDSQHISRIERAVSGVSLDRLFEIADALEVDVAKLFDFSLLDGR